MGIDYAALANQQAKVEDQSVAQESVDYEYTPPEAGVTLARFVSYVELGKHPQKAFQGKAKPDVEMVRLVFELLHPKKNIKEIEVDGKKQTISEYIAMTMPKKLGDKAKFKKIFDLMRYGRDITHMAQMLNNEFIVTVHHNTVETDGKKQVYANLNDASGVYSIGAPFTVDAITQEKKDIRPAFPQSIRGITVFFWNNPTKETWDSLFIDGSREVKNGDKTEVISNNWLQERIMSAKDYVGSPLEAMLAGVADLSIAKEAAQSPSSSGTVESGLDLPPAAGAPSTASDDPLAALGLAA